ncbi:MAG: hypothetical protein IJZ23_09935 [Roseburia sp.]|nr:hypothetical protein [Roseburia sp.]
MKNTLSFLLRFVFVGLAGVLLHFTYDWSGENTLVGYFSSVNESTWEHLKLIFFPMLVLTLFELNYHKNGLTEFLSARTLAIFTGMLFIVVVFYTFWGVSGKLIDYVNISIYFAGVFFAFVSEQFFQKKSPALNLSNAIILLAVFTFLFILFTYTPPKFGIFYDLSLHPKG